MKYSYEYKRKCVEMYREGKWPETPEGIQERNFHEIIRKWFRIEESCGPDALRHKMQNKVWTVEEKYELVAKVLAGASYKETAFSSGIEDSLLRQWVKRYKIEGYEGFAAVAFTVCTSPLSLSTPICALYPKCHVLPFLS